MFGNHSLGGCLHQDVGNQGIDVDNIETRSVLFGESANLDFAFRENVPFGGYENEGGRLSFIRTAMA